MIVTPDRRKQLPWAIISILCLCFSFKAQGEDLRLTQNEYFSGRGVNVLVFSNWYNDNFSDSKMSGVELIHHGERTVTNGDIRLQATPEQWDEVPVFLSRKVDTSKKSVEAFLHYPQHKLNYSVKVQSVADQVVISVHLPVAVPAALVGKAGFNLEFLPSAYFEKAWLMDDQSGHFPLYPTGAKEQNGKVEAQPLAVGQQLILAPTDPLKAVTIKSAGEPLHLYDGRNKAQNGWFVVRSLLPKNQTGKVLEWTLSVKTLPQWLRTPVIGHSQVGYHPQQNKIAVIELDANDVAKDVARLVRIGRDGKAQSVLQKSLNRWGSYKRYRYWQFDFSTINKEGLYYIEYGEQRSTPFRIAADVYANIWHPTLDIFFPVQMDHLLVNEAYRVWHGASHLDDALQAPINHVHFDLYAQGPTTDTEYQPGEHIPGLNIGGWYDAGDYDIRTQTQYSTVKDLVNVWEQFKLMRDMTTVDYSKKFVDLHVPDGKPDLLQQIEHGTLALIAQFRAVGHAIPGIIVSDLSQYTHLGDGLTMTDNLIYNPAMDLLQNNGFESGVADDRWAFTSETSALNYGSSAALAAASRALKGYNDSLAQECLAMAIKTWQLEKSRAPKTFRHGNTTGRFLPGEELNAALELLVTTGDKQYAAGFLQRMEVIENQFPQYAVQAVRALPYMDKAYQEKLLALTQAHRKYLDQLQRENPYGVNITEGGWAGNGEIVSAAMTNYYLHRTFPKIITKEDVLKGLNYLLGTHPHSNLSFVSAVGAKSKKVAYGMNRADFSFIAGGIVPGVLILKPDYPENKEDWPFLWGENEYVVNLGASYLFLANAAQHLWD